MSPIEMTDLSPGATCEAAETGPPVEAPRARRGLPNGSSPIASVPKSKEPSTSTLAASAGLGEETEFASSIWRCCRCPEGSGEGDAVGSGTDD